MADLDKLRSDAETARQYAQHHGVKIWTEHIFAALALADTALARIAKVKEVVEAEKHWNEGCGWDVPAGAVLRALTEGENDAAV